MFPGTDERHGCEPILKPLLITGSCFKPQSEGKVVLSSTNGNQPCICCATSDHRYPQVCLGHISLSATERMLHVHERDPAEKMAPLNKEESGRVRSKSIVQINRPNANTTRGCAQNANACLLVAARLDEKPPCAETIANSRMGSIPHIDRPLIIQSKKAMLLSTGRICTARSSSLVLVGRHCCSL